MGSNVDAVAGPGDAAGPARAQCYAFYQHKLFKFGKQQIGKSRLKDSFPRAKETDRLLLNKCSHIHSSTGGHLTEMNI